MRISQQYKALKKYIGERHIGDAVNEFELHRCHFRITEDDKAYIADTAAMLGRSMSSLCCFMIERTLPLVETALFKNENETDYDAVMGIVGKRDFCEEDGYMEHRYEAGGYGCDLFAELTRDSFLMMQYLKEQLHFYSYCELFRLIVAYFRENLDLSDIEIDEDGQVSDENAEIALGRVKMVAEKIQRRLEKFRSTPRKSRTIMPEILSRVRSTAACLLPPTQIYLAKMVT